MSRLESGFLKPRTDWCDLPELLHEVVSGIEESGIRQTIYIQAEPDMPLFRLDKGKRLNTKPRRLEAIHSILSAYTELELSVWNITDIKEAIRLLERSSYYDNSVVIIFDSISAHFDDGQNDTFKLASLVPIIEKVSSNTIKCHALSVCVKYLGKSPTTPSIIKYDKLVELALTHISQTWDRIGNSIFKIRAAYEISSALSSVKPIESENYLANGERISDDTSIASRAHSSLYSQSIRLLIRLYAGLLSRQKNTSYEKLSILIDYVPAEFDRISLWGEVAVRAYLANATDICSDVVAQKIMPLITKFKDGPTQLYFYYAMKGAGSAIFLAQPENFDFLIDSLDEDQKENIVTVICSVLLTKTYDDDPFDEGKAPAKFSYGDAIKLIGLLDNVKKDYKIYSTVSKLCKVAKGVQNTIVREHKIDIKSKLERYIQRTLPNNLTGISHNGYLIASLSCIQVFSTNPPTQATAEFEKLEADVLSIPNVSDRALVYAVLATNENEKNKKHRIVLLEKAFNEADKVPSIQEKVARYEEILSYAQKISLELFSEKLLKIRHEVYKLDESEIFPTFRRLIDLAFKSEKGIVQRLLSNIDSDPARKSMNEPATNHLENLNVEKEVLNDYSKFGQIKSRRQMGEIAWQMLGQLNADSRNSRDINTSIKILHTASRLPLHYSYPLLSFFIQNSIQDENISEGMLSSFYEAAYLLPFY